MTRSSNAHENTFYRLLLKSNYLRAETGFTLPSLRYDEYGKLLGKSLKWVNNVNCVTWRGGCRVVEIKRYVVAQSLSATTTCYSCHMLRLPCFTAAMSYSCHMLSLPYVMAVTCYCCRIQLKNIYISWGSLQMQDLMYVD